ncbi:MAG: serine--tRNA ligase [Phycisphaerales bacterium]|nr:serine--tRNA ligase [Phycisphaerales bacterium]
MIPLVLLTEKTEQVKIALQKKYFKNIEWVDDIVQQDVLRRKTQSELDAQLAQINRISKDIGTLIKEGKKEEATIQKQAVTNLKKSIDIAQNALKDIEHAMEDKMIKLPNIPHEKVPAGKTLDDNVLIRAGGNKSTIAQHTPLLCNWDLVKAYNIVDFELGAKITGSGFPLYIGQGAKLQRALIQYFLDFNTSRGYVEVLPPFLVNEASAFGTGALPDKDKQMYHVSEDNFFLIPTSEVPVTNMYRDVIVQEDELPIKLTAYSPCFRREAGSFGKDVRGLNRIHQFEKVEIVQIVHPDKSYQVLDEMVGHVEQLLQSLELPYRIILLCGGDMSFTSAMTYDFEVYSQAQDKWLEVSSVSNFEAFQTNRMKCRFKSASTNKTQFPHSLNGSSLALSRIFAVLIENNQGANGIRLPQVLHQYMGANSIKK